jgi:2-hydroxyacyl-CoA lyase 1
VPFDARCTAAELTAAAAALGRARRPALLVGEDARWSEPWTPLRQIVERFGIPFATSPMARGFLPDSHPLCFSDVRGPLLDGADLVMAVGVRFDWTFRFGREIGPESTVLAIGVGASDLGEIASPRIVVPGSPVHILPVLLEACDSGAARDDSRTDALGEQRTAYRSRIEQRCAQRLDPMSPFQWLRELRDALPASAMTILDGNVVMSAAQAVLRAELPLSRITPGKTGCMGSAIPFAIGAQLAQGDRPVVAICGDFAFGLNALELETAVRLEVPIIVIVANNGGLGGVTRQRALYGANHPDRVCEFAQGVRHDRLMAALGGLGLRVERPGELAGALATALAHGGPSCIDVMTNGETELSAVL